MAITIITSQPTFDQRGVDETSILQQDRVPVLQLRQDNVTAHVIPALHLTRPLSKGTLYVTEGQLCFYSQSSSIGFAIDYPTIGLHAVSRSPGEGIGPSIYCQLETNAIEGDSDVITTNGDSLEDEEDDLREIYFTPEDEGSLDIVFQALSDCAALHPDEDEEEAEDGWVMQSDNDEVDGENDADINGDAAAIVSVNNEQELLTSGNADELSPQGRATLARLDAMLQQSEETQEAPTTRYEDAAR